MYEDKEIAAIHEKFPVAPTHIIVFSKEAIGPSLSQCSGPQAALLGRMLFVAGQLAVEAGIHTSGYRIVLNDGVHGRQTVPSVALHLIGGRPLSWPPA